ncbi:hypothetical protein D0B54_20700 [Solimonas sp. K1W22B-7]|uniref:hypothetical protein n=1 Tax=Solimonas sp. K1W22B-7 TaxID=2303331 RepID=UPI000E333A86|nr:hypothetical protein [Solimonas sp. K1W22B-7]AXQ30950.1 hypothetical protein D0B54_20700 [Solimonas sp. K1W22B-7]
MELLSQLFPATARGLLHALLMFLPPLLLLADHRARWWSRLLWALATQLCWLFVLLYAWVRQQRYLGDPQLAEFPLAEAIGWWSYAFPWMVYLVFRAMHPPAVKPAPP